MNKQKTNTIIKFTLREYLESKFFIIFNIISLISVIVGFNFSSFKQILHIPEKVINYKIEVVDNSNILYDEFINHFVYSGDYEISKIPENTYTKDNIEEENIILEIEEKDKEHFIATITTKQSLKNEIKEALDNTLVDIQHKMLKADYNLNDEELDIIIKGPEIKTVFLSVVSEGYIEKMFIKYMVGAVTMFIAMLIFSKIGNDIAQEKQSKSSEYILTTVSAKEYLFAKVFGNILFVVIQFLLMIIFFFVGTGLSQVFNMSSINVENINLDITSQVLSKESIELLLALIVYNILTLILLSFVQGALSAKSTSIQDASNSSLLLVMIYTILFVSTMGIIDQYTSPNLFMYIFSTLPVVSSFFVPAMMIIGQSTALQIIVSLILLIISIPLVFNYSQKKFKEGILNYSKQKKGVEEDQTNIILNKRTFKRVGSVLGIGIIIFLGSNVILSMLAQPLIVGLLSDTFSKTDMLLFTQITVSALSLFFAYKYVMSQCEIKNNTHPQKAYTTRFVFISFGIIALLQIVLDYIYAWLNLDYDVTALFDISVSSSAFTKILFVITIAITPAIFEELLCRKALITFLRPHGRLFAIVISSFIFGLIHMNLQQFVFAFIVGLLLALIYEYTKNIKITMVIHFINNFVSTVPLLLGEKYIDYIFYLYIAFIVIGFVIMINILVNKISKTNIANKLLSLKQEFINRSKPGYIFIIGDFMFDISIIALLLLSIYQQSLLELLQ